ncbi:MAG: DoxX family protein [Chitinophagaceae bacterium]|nr:DoxX family protein [Chitinophagaceae bacterium]
MKRFLSTNYTDGVFNFAMLILRVGLGVLLLQHGYYKLVHFSTMKHSFLNFMGMGSTLSLSLSIFAEFFCAIFVMIGLFTRFTVIPIIIGLGVAVVKAHNKAIFAEGELASVYIIGFIVILLLGPGKVSVDRLIAR